jgi:hypothetical protein
MRTFCAAVSASNGGNGGLGGSLVLVLMEKWMPPSGIQMISA